MNKPLVFALLACLMLWIALFRAGFWIAERVTGFDPWWLVGR